MGLPQGIVIIWSGTSSTIPSGWFACDGANGTPDLQNLFVVGAGSTYSLNSTGGFADAIVPTHNHTVSGPNAGGNHTHTGPRYSSDFSSFNFGTTSFRRGELRDTGGQVTSTTGNASIASHSHSGGALNGTGVNPTNQNLPPYYSLFFIMKGGN